jgi:hypothetical protein
MSIGRLQQRASDRREESPPDCLEGYAARKTYFDGVNRSFFNEVKFGNSGETKGTDLEKVPLGTARPEGNRVRIQRLHNRYRWMVSVVKYQNTSTAPSDRHIPADPDPAVQGEPVRYVYFKFGACVENNAHEISVRLRDPQTRWLQRRDGSDGYASRTVRVSVTTWEQFDGILGPVRADQPCYVSLDIMPGPKGEKQCLFIRDLQILEVRKQQ